MPKKLTLDRDNFIEFVLSEIREDSIFRIYIIADKEETMPYTLVGIDTPISPKT